jgi:hypothetical protein
MTITDKVSKGNFICLNFPQQGGRDENFLQVPETQLENPHGGWGLFGSHPSMIVAQRI